MDKNDHKRQQLIAETLSSEIDASQAEVLELALQSWKQLATHLSPLIGDAGFCALYGRAIRLVIAQHEWLTTSPSSHSIDALFATLKKDLTSITPSLASTVNQALLDTFTKLLSGLIGAALTIRLLHAAWHGKSGQENSQEHQ